MYANRIERLFATGLRDRQLASISFSYSNVKSVVRYIFIQVKKTRCMDELSTDDAPESIGPYSQGIRDGDRIFVSGQGPLDPETGDVVSEDVGEQTERTLQNAEAILEAGGASLDDVVKATVFVVDMDDYDAVNEVYGEYMSEPFPARSAVEVGDLPGPFDVEIEVIAEVAEE